MDAIEAELIEPPIVYPRPKVLAPHIWSEDEVRRLDEIESNTRAKNTRAAYRSDFKRFRAWCEDKGVSPLPATVDTVKHYARSMDEDGFKVRSIRRATSAIHFAHTRCRLQSPIESEEVRECLRGLARERGSAVSGAPPILAQDLKAMIGALDVSTNRGARDSALLLMGWTMALRRSETIGLDVEDLEIRERGIVANVRKQKNDQFGEGYRKAVVLASDPKVCTTLVMRRWLRMAGITSGPVFRPVFNGDRVGDARLSARACDRIVKRAAELAGLEDMGFSSHSLRAGFVTQAAKDGKPLHAIQQQTGHKSLTTLMGYIRRAVELGEDSPTVGLL